MHWFDRLSRGVAASEAAAAGLGRESGISTRRSLLKGAFAATATAAFVPAAAAAAGATGGRVTRGGGSPGDGVIGECESCFARVNNAGREAVEACKKVQGAGRGKKKKASQAARQLACQAKAHKKWGRTQTECRLGCTGKETEPVQPPSEVSGHASCPEGTARCTDRMCCANGDNCCICVNGFEGKVCCANVIGCDCC
jgi:hypothetical protein